MGTPDFAVATLKKLIDQKYNVVGVITVPDKPAGRGRKLQESAVKQYAIKEELKILQPINLKNKEFIKDLKNLDANLQIVVAFRMLPKAVWQIPKFGTFNLHASLLPNYRGAAPINWAIINGETTTGVSTFFIDEEIDTGDMILQKSIAIKAHENAGALHDKLMALGSDLVIETIRLIEFGKVETTPQDENITIKSANKLNRDNCKIDWHANTKDIYNKIRGLSPYPTAWSVMINGTEKLDVKIYKATSELKPHDFPIGKLVVEKHVIKVATKEGFINILEMKLPGKRNMDAKSLLNGYQFQENAKML